MFPPSIRRLPLHEIWEPGTPTLMKRLQDSRPLVTTDGNSNANPAPNEKLTSKCCCCLETVNIQLRPCGHKVICQGFVARAGGVLRRCPSCRGDVHPQTFANDKGSAEARGEREKEEMARLRTQIASLEAEGIRGLCKVCAQPVQLFFMCGHATCKRCSQKLERCPTCDKLIKMRRPLFL